MTDLRATAVRRPGLPRITINVCRDMLKNFWLKRVFLAKKDHLQYNINGNISAEEAVKIAESMVR